MRFLLFLSWVLLTGLGSPAIAQTYGFGQASRLQLPTPETYKVIQDRNGYIWIATDNGLYRFHSGGSQLIGERNGAAITSVFTVYETCNGSILFATGQGKLFRVEGDFAVELPCSRKGFMHGVTGIIYRIQEDDRQNLFIMTSHATYWVNKTCEVIKKFPLQDTINFHLELKNGFLLPNNSFRYKACRDYPSLQSVYIHLNDPEPIKANIPCHYGAIGYYRFLTARWQQYWVIGYCRTLLLISPGRQVQQVQLPGDIIALRTDKLQRLWVGTYKNGFLHYLQPGDLGHPVRGLSSYSVSDICVDQEEGVWLTTLEQGVFYSPGTEYLQHTAFKNISSPYQHLVATRYGVVASSPFQKKLLIKENGTVETFTIPGIANNSTLDNFIQTPHSDWYITRPLVLKHTRSSGAGYRIRIPTGFITAAQAINEDTLAVITYNHLTVIEKGKPGKTWALPDNCYHLQVLADKSILIGSLSAVYYAGDLRYPVFHKIPGVQGHVVKFLTTTDGNTWVLVQGSGLYLFNTGKLRLVLPAAGQEHYFDMLEPVPGHCLIATNLGITAYSISSLLAGDASGAENKIQLVEKEVYAMAYFHNRIYMSMQGGIFSLPAQLASFTKHPFQIRLRKWQVGNEFPAAAKAGRGLSIPYGAPGMLWLFDVMTYRSTAIKLRYLLSGSRKDSGLLYGNALQLQSLQAGNYELTVWGERSDGSRSNSLQLSFRINPPFWQTPVFVFSSLILSGLIFYYLIKLRIDRARKKDAEKQRIETELLQSQLQALQAQMNPHFVFNAINSIQLLVLDGRRQDAYFYLTEFSRLIRRVLLQAKDGLVALADELETLRLYTTLELLRFSNQLKYTLQVDPSLNCEKTRLPIMLLQPVIENAIRHGLAEKKEGAILAVHITHEPANRTVVMTVTDNGTGRTKDVLKPIEEHLSLATGNINKRLAKLNSIYATDRFKLTIKDLFHPDGTAAGTSVSFSIPDNL